jgi:hypothetical protein
MRRPTLDEFLDGPYDRAWIEHPTLEVYLRLIPRYLDGTRYPRVLDIGTVDVKPCHQKGEGHFTRFLAEVIAAAEARGIPALYVQNVQTARFAAFFERNGFTLSMVGANRCYVRFLRDAHK